MIGFNAFCDKSNREMVMCCLWMFVWPDIEQPQAPLSVDSRMSVAFFSLKMREKEMVDKEILF
jgi:hypothetical protein